MNQKQSTSGGAGVDLQLVDAAIAFLETAQARLRTDNPVLGAHLEPDDAIMNYVAGMFRAAFTAVGGGIGPVRDVEHAFSIEKLADLQSSLAELIAQKHAYVRRHGAAGA